MRVGPWLTQQCHALYRVQVPTSNPDEGTIAAATATLHSLAAVKDAEKSPVDRYALPVTGNMEVRGCGYPTHLS